MDLEEYLNSGIIEDYCLGVLDPNVRASVVQNALLYEEIQMAIEENEAALKNYVEERVIDLEMPLLKKRLLLRLSKNKPL